MYLIDSPVRPHLFVLTPPEQMMPLDLIPIVRGIIAAARKFAPILTPLDIFMTSVEFTALCFEIVRLERNRPVNTALVVECRQLALHAVACCDEQLARDAGILTRTILPLDRLRERLDLLMASWFAEVQAIDDCVRRRDVANLTLRDIKLYEGRLAITQSRIVDTDALLRSLRAATVAAARRDRRRIDRDDLRPEAVTGNWHLVAAKTENVLTLATVDDQGRLAPGVRQVRDGLLQGKEPPRPIGLDEVATGEPKDPRRALTSEVDDHDEQRVAEKAIARFIQERLPLAKAGSARQIVLQHLADLLKGSTSLSKLAETTGKAISTLSEAFQAECVALRRFIEGGGRG